MTKEQEALVLEMLSAIGDIEPMSHYDEDGDPYEECTLCGSQCRWIFRHREGCIVLLGKRLKGMLTLGGNYD